MDNRDYSDDFLRQILGDTQTIALVGASNKPHRASYRVMHYLQQEGYRVFPVNPRLVGTELFDEPVYGCLTDIPEPVDMVDVFRRSDMLDEVVDNAIKIGAKVLWTQLGVYSEEAAAKAEAAGMQVVMNRCPKIELPRLRVSA